MSTLRYQSAGNVRKRAHNVNKTLWTDDEINEVIDRWSVDAHVQAGRALTSPWVEGTDDIYEIVRTYVLNAAACEIMAGLEIDDQGKCEKAADKALELIVSGGGAVVVVTNHFDLVEGLDEDHYSQQFS
jgi:hypothetical protein